MSGRPVAFLEIGALLEEHWTGIPNVAAAIAADGMMDERIEWRFIYENLMVPHDDISAFISQRSGLGGLKLLADLAWKRQTVPRKLASTSACIFTNIKPVRRFFGREASIVHDLSTILTPQFHGIETIDYVANRIRGDIETSDHLFCVSKATLEDIRAYFGVEDRRLSVLRLGVAIDPGHVSAARVAANFGMSIDPYVVVVGTLEPRKNGRIILEYLTENPGFAERFNIVFTGREGWLDEKSRLMDAVERAGVSPDRITFLGFVSEAEKIALILNSAFCIYPSFFEGFGLPILEAAALGKITVCSNSSSMPEVAPDKCVFFNPLSMRELGEALNTAEHRAAQTRSSQSSLPDIMAKAKALSWHNCYPQIADWVLQQT